MNPGEALIDSIAQAVAMKVERMVATNQRLLNIDSAARYLDMTPAALRHKVACGEVVVVRLDGKLRFDRRDLDRLIDGARREGV